MKMPLDNIKKNMFAPCGMNCMVCYKHCNSNKPCDGCFFINNSKPNHCRNCKIKDCLKDKEFKYCFECSSFPCKLIKNLEKSYQKRYQTSFIENSEFVKNHGIDVFMQKQKEEYTCSECGGIISLHDRECSECHQKIKE